MTSSEPDRGPFLLLNGKHILHRLEEWFPGAAEELVVVTTARSVPDGGTAAVAGRCVTVVDDFEDADDLLAELGRRHGVTRVLSTGEREVLPAARTRARLGLPGQDVATATAFRDKFVMKTAVAAAGVAVAPMRTVTSDDELRAAAGELGYPLVLKHRSRGGSNGTRVIVGPDRLPRIGAGDGHFIAEQWVDGDFYQVNGLMRDGRIVLGQPSFHPYSDWFSVAYDAPGMSGMLAAGHPMSARLLRGAADVLAALPPVPGLCAFQTEWFHTPDDRLVLCETACRAGGSLMVDTHEETLGVNLHGASLLGQAGRIGSVASAPPARRLGYARFPPARGVLRNLPARCELPRVVRYAAPGEPGRRYDGSTVLGAYVAEVVFELVGDDIATEMAEIERWWDEHEVWAEHENPVPDRYKRTRVPNR